MSNSNLVNVNVPASTNNYTIGRSGRKIEMITIHHMAGVLTASECGKIFQGNRKASAHYGIGNDGEIAKYVDEENTAWANSNWNANCKAVTIEVSNNKTGGDWTVSDKALNSLIKLVADIAKRNKLGKLVKGQNVTWHRMYIATTCPGAYLLSKMNYIIEKANDINRQADTINVVAPNKKTVEEIAKEVIAGKWGNGQERFNKLEKAGYNGSEVQAKVNELLGIKTAIKTNIKSNEEIANEVIQGKWGNGIDRKDRLTKAGYDYNAVQRIVNSKLK